MRSLLPFVVLILAASVSAAAPAKPSARKQVRYLDVHPLPGAAFCAIEGPHVHAFEPEHATVLYRMHGGSYVFVGDPAPFEYEGPKHAYYGHHPIVLDDDLDDSFCYLDGSHYHITAPPANGFVARGGAYWYVGTWPAHYKAQAPRYTKINLIYEPLVYARPAVTIAPPPEYRPPVIEVVVKPRRPRAAITSPRGDVRVPIVVVDYDYDYDIYYHRRHHHHHDRDDDSDSD